MSRVMRKPAFGRCENKDAGQEARYTFYLPSDIIEKIS